MTIRKAIRAAIIAEEKDCGYSYYRTGKESLGIRVIKAGKKPIEFNTFNKVLDYFKI